MQKTCVIVLMQLGSNVYFCTACTWPDLGNRMHQLYRWYKNCTKVAVSSPWLFTKLSQQNWLCNKMTSLKLLYLASIRIHHVVWLVCLVCSVPIRAHRPCFRVRKHLTHARKRLRTREIKSVVYGRNVENEPVSRIKMADYRVLVKQGG